MDIIELDRALRQLRLGGMAAVLETRLRQAQAEAMAPIRVVVCWSGIVMALAPCTRSMPSKKAVGRRYTTGKPDQRSTCSASQCCFCWGLLVVSVSLISDTVICDRLTKAFTPRLLAATATLVAASVQHWLATRACL